jgi:hypothetical protein
VTETITNLINQVIKRQQEILQIIIGCNCSETTEPTPVDQTTAAATTTTTAAPVFAAKGNFVKPDVNAPVDTRIPTVVPVVSVIPYDQGKVTYVEDKISIVEGVKTQ